MLQKQAALLVGLSIARVCMCAAQPAGGADHPHPMYHYPRWSPDGTRIVVVSISSGDSHLLVIPVAGGNARSIETPKIAPMAADWISPNRISIVGHSTAGAQTSFAIDIDGRNLRPFRRDSIASATRDSSILLYEAQRSGGSDIVSTDRQRRASRQLTRGFWAEQPSISPDQRQIVFEKRVDPNRMDRSEVVVMALDGSGQVTIAAGTDPSWSPDGKQILFKSMDASGMLWVSVVDVATRAARRLTLGVHPEWSPTGDRILFMRDGTGGDGEVYVVSASGGDSRCLTCSLAQRKRPVTQTPSPREGRHALPAKPEVR